MYLLVANVCLVQSLLLLSLNALVGVIILSKPNKIDDVFHDM